MNYNGIPNACLISCKSLDKKWGWIKLLNHSMKHHHRNHHKLWHETLFRPLALHCTQWCTHTILHSLPPPLATRLYKNVQYVLRNKLWTSSWSVLPSCYQVYSIFSLTSGVHAQLSKYVGQAFRKNGKTSGSHVIFQQNYDFAME